MPRLIARRLGVRQLIDDDAEGGEGFIDVARLAELRARRARLGDSL